MHEAHEPNLLLDVADASLLACEDLAEIDFASTDADRAAAGQEALMDEREGIFNVQIIGTQTNGKPLYVHAKGHTTDKAYVLCGSASDDPALYDDFGKDAYICITDTIAFARAIANHIQGFTKGLEGPCLYLWARTLTAVISDIPSLPDGSLSKSDVDNLKNFAMDKIRHRSFFLKDQRYRGDVEYRLLWFVEGEVEPNIKVFVPEAQRFCFRGDKQA